MLGPKANEAREAELRYISRRRAEPEREPALWAAPMPTIGATIATEAPPGSRPPAWPVDAPKRPIAIHQLFFEGIYCQVRAAIEAVVVDVREAVEAAKEGIAQPTMLNLTAQVFRPEDTQLQWARECV